MGSNCVARTSMGSVPNCSKLCGSNFSSKRPFGNTRKQEMILASPCKCTKNVNVECCMLSATEIFYSFGNAFCYPSSFNVDSKSKQISYEENPRICPKIFPKVSSSKVYMCLKSWFLVKSRQTPNGTNQNPK